MKSIVCFSVLFLYSIVTLAQVASFNAPDTVCVNSPVTITNTSTGGSSWYWNFCSGGLTQTPTAINLGNPGGYLNVPVFTETAKDGSNFYAFVVDNNSNLVRLSFGNSMLNTPVATSFGNLSNTMPIQGEGIQIVHDADGWHIIVVGGSAIPPNQPSIAKVDFGASLANNSPTAVNWGNIGNLSYPIDLYLFQENGQYYAFTTNAENNTITRFSFGTDFRNPPTGVNLGNIGNLDYPTGIYASKNNGNWYVFIVNAVNSTITRLDFGNSLLNVPNAVNLGNPSNALNTPRDIYIFDDCGNISGLIAGGSGEDVVRIDFAGGVITGAITGFSYGNIGGFNYPHSLSSVFREGDNLYTIVANAFNNTLSRVMFASCNSSSVASSTLQTPPSYTYTKAGTYTVTLSMNEGLPTQQSYCHTIVVTDTPKVHMGTVISCNNTPVKLDPGAGFSYYHWFDGSKLETYNVTTTGKYAVEVSNGGCTAKDTAYVRIDPAMSVNLDVQQIECQYDKGYIAIHANGGTPPYQYFVNNVGYDGRNQFPNLLEGTYQLMVLDTLGCTVTATQDIIDDPNRKMLFTYSYQSPSCEGLSDGQISVNMTDASDPVQYSLDGITYQSNPTFNNLPSGKYSLFMSSRVCFDTLNMLIQDPPVLELSTQTVDESCNRGDGAITLNIFGGTPPFAEYLDGQPVSGTVGNLKAGTHTVSVTDARGCTTSNNTVLNNVTYPPVMVLDHDITINIGETVPLYAVNAPDYQWSPATGLDCTDCPSPNATPLQPTTYVVTTLTGRNCVQSDSVTIHLTYDLHMFIPNAFSPNNDGLNDVFRVKYEGVALFVMAIYDRWGKLLFTTQDINAGWDGSVKGVKLLPGSYAYMVKYAYYGEEQHIRVKSGTVTLVQ
jgi:gliding motility-associated-like protein